MINRGNYRRGVFADAGAADCFERCLGEACLRFRWLVQAYVVMVNHFHLALTTPEPNLSEGMKWLQGTWATRVNRFRDEIGRPFQGRYKALHVEPGHVLAQVAHYIHLNPVDAGIVPAEQLPEYRWSSLRRFVRGPRPGWLGGDTVLADTGGLPDSPAGWRSYLQFLALMADADKQSRAKRLEQLCSGWAIGSDDFMQGLREKLKCELDGVHRFELLGSDSAALKQARGVLWEETLQKIASALEIDLARLPAAKSAETKVLIAALMKKVTSVSNRWLGERLGMGGPASVSSLVTRFQREGHTNSPEFQSLHSRFAS